MWLSKGWALPSHESKGTVKVIAYKKDIEPVDDAKEAEQAKAQGLETWLGREQCLEEWGMPRYFAVPRERVAEVGLEKAFNDLVQFATKLGYQSVWGPWGRVCEAREGGADKGSEISPDSR